jgi:hypothetical protein
MRYTERRFDEPPDIPGLFPILRLDFDRSAANFMLINLTRDPFESSNISGC